MKISDFSGLGLALLAGLLATWLGGSVPLLGASLVALLAGLLASPFLQDQRSLQPGLAKASKFFLQGSIVLLGFRLSFSALQTVGLTSYLLSVPLVLLAFGLALGLGRLLGLRLKLATLIGFGTAICGGSAIASAAPILEAEEEDVALALATIFAFNLAALVLFPLAGRLLGLDAQAFGLWAGTAINDTSSVVAAGYGHSQEAGDLATLVKLARTLLIVPACLLLSLSRLRQWQSRSQVSVKNLIPAFLPWFLLASLTTSFLALPAWLLTLSRFLSQWLMAASLFAVGSKMSLSQLRQAGARPLVLGLVTWAGVSLASLGTIWLFF